MASIIPGYEYDIFISYRQKDNKGDKWVSQFVDALKTELEATFKEEISVYFDINPHDGLLETHDVADSLKDKMKCLVFIPVISRTYCDPKSFAWEHEFKAFLELAAQDQFGMKVKLPNGNVASRVLPIRIHELDSKDLLLCESALGTYLRGVEFIYKEPGVNKPLKADDDEKKNLSNTKYRIQINKVANAVQEIISGLIAQKNLPKTEKLQSGIFVEKPAMAEKLSEAASPAKPVWHKIYSGFVIAVLLILAGIFFYPKVFKKDRKEIFSAKGEISVAVMPFQNLTNDAARNFWEVMIQDNLITSLSNVRELKIRQTESVLSLLDNADLTNYASLTPALARSVSQKLDANVFLHGSINQVGNVTRLNAKLIDSKTDEVFKSFQIDGSPENILFLTDSLSLIIRDYLIVEMLKKEITPDFQKYLGSVKSPLALNYALDGYRAFARQDVFVATEMFLKAVEIDSNYFNPMIWLTLTYLQQALFDDAKKWAIRINENADKLTRTDKVFAEYIYSRCFGNPVETIKCLRQILEIDDFQPFIYFDIGNHYNEINQFERAIPEFEKSLEIYKKLGKRPMWVYNYTALSYAYFKQGLYRKAKRVIVKAENDFPSNSILLFWQAVLALTEGKTKKANDFIERFIFSYKENLGSEFFLNVELANIYSLANRHDIAEEYLRKELALYPNNKGFMNILAYFLIDNNRNIDEGLDLVEKALRIVEHHPYDRYKYRYLKTKGWGLYKQGRYHEALEILQESWDLLMEQSVYDHRIFLHLEEARKAVANL